MGYLAFPGVSFLKAILSGLIYENLRSARKFSRSAGQTYSPSVCPGFPDDSSSQKVHTGRRSDQVALRRSERWTSAKFYVFEAGLRTTTSSEPATPEIATPVCSGLEDRTAVWKAGIADGSSPIFTAPFQAETS